MNFRRERLTLDQAFEIAGFSWTGDPYITFDPKVKHQYRIIRQQSHDGTQIFTCQLIEDALFNLAARTSYFKSMGLPPPDCAIHYTVGEIWLVTAYGDVDLPCGRYPGQRERIIIPVMCEYRQVGRECAPPCDDLANSDEVPDQEHDALADVEIDEKGTADGKQ